MARIVLISDYNFLVNRKEVICIGRAPEEVLEEIDLVLIMSVNPGFGGQSFIPNALSKIKRLKQMIMEKGYNHIEIEVDGGIKLNNIQEVAEAGADIIVSGSGIFNGKPAETIAEMKKIING